MPSLFRSLTLFTLTILIVGLSSCAEDTLTPTPSKPLVTGPLSVQFGDVPVDLCKDTTIRYDNRTGRSITITSITFTNAAYTWNGVALPVTLAADASIDAVVRYCPQDQATAAGAMVVKGTGGDSVKVMLNGTGVEPSVIHAKAGSAYTMDVTILDSATGETQTSTTIYTIVEDNATYAGKTNVRRFATDGEPSTAAFAYNADKSISMNFGEEIPGWLTLPTHGGAGSTLIVFDTTMVVQGIPVRLVVDISSFYEGLAPVTVKGKTYQAKKIRLRSTQTATFVGASQVEYTDNFVWWVSEIGFYARREGPYSDFTITSGYESEVLTDYTLVK